MLRQAPPRRLTTPRNAAQANIIAAWTAADRSAVDALGRLQAELEREEQEDDAPASADQEHAHARAPPFPADAGNGLDRKEVCGAGSETPAAPSTAAGALPFSARETASARGGAGRQAAWRQAAGVAAGMPDHERDSCSAVSFASLPSVVTWHTLPACAHQASFSPDAGGREQDACQVIQGVGSLLSGDDAGNRLSTSRSRRVLAGDCVSRRGRRWWLQLGP